MEIRPPRDILSKEEFRAWSRPNVWRLAFDLLGVWLQVVVSVAVYLLWPSWPVAILAMAVIGGAQHASALIAHEGAHYLLIPGNRRLNDQLAGYFFAAPIALPFSTYRQRHMDHHRYVSTENDTKELYRRSFRGWRLWLEVVRSLTGLDYLEMVGKVLQGVVRPSRAGEPRSERKASMKADLVTIVVAQLVLILLFAIWDWKLYFTLWVVPTMTFLSLFGKLRSAVEHQPLDSEEGDSATAYFRDTEKPYFRTVEVVGIERLLLNRINFNYHAEHHLWPQICYQYLPTLSRRLRERSDFHAVIYDYSYFRVLAKLWRGQ